MSPDNSELAGGAAGAAVTAGAAVSVGALGAPSLARTIFAGLPHRYDLLEAALSLGQNARWRQAMIDHAAACSPGTVLDVATGTGGVAFAISDQLGASVVGLDLTEQMLREALSRAERRSSHNGAPRRPAGGASRRRAVGPRPAFVEGRAERLPFHDSTFDAVTFTYLLRYVEAPAATLGELARVLKPGGVMASLEFYVPPRPAWHVAWLFYTRAVLPAAGGAAGGRAWYDVGRFLGPNISGHYRRYPLDWTVNAWQAAGMAGVGHHLMSLGGGLVMWGTKAVA
ncbi:MAG: class I SAM-dependent methyltransferase [Acidimicrobiales bacterium]